MPALKNLVGQRFGRLVIVRRESRKWFCRCDCGGTKLVITTSLTHGQTRSCGCLVKESLEKARLVNTKHGRTNTPEWKAWKGVLDRCSTTVTTPNKDYAGRGIKVCPRWATSFLAFYEDMGPRPSPLHSIDRKDNDGDYTPENCRWATSAVQNSNTRLARYLTYNGTTKTMSAWARDLGVLPTIIWQRLKSGWPVSRAVTEQPKSIIKRNARISHNGKEMTISEWAKLLRIPQGTLHGRLFIWGWSPERAFTTPAIPPKLRRARVSGGRPA
jgi:hypothetical protein